MTTFQVKRIYEDTSDDDGARVLVDRLWPRGIRKADAELDLWAKDATPSAELRHWFHEHPDEYDEFAQRYGNELDDAGGALDEIRDAGSTVTLLTANRDPDHSHIPTLLAALQSGSAS